MLELVVSVSVSISAAQLKLPFAHRSLLLPVQAERLAPKSWEVEV
jgi:hypothetical protein